MYTIGKLYKVSTLVIGKTGKSKMRKLKYFDLLDETGRVVGPRIPKKERKFYRQFIALANEEGVQL